MFEEEQEVFVSFIRLLQDNGTIIPTNSTKGGNECTDHTDTQMLDNTMTLYGGLFFIAFIIFCALRRRHPQTFAVRRGSFSDHATHLADSSHGFFGWIWSLLAISDDEFLEECGMDALCLIRIQDFGLRISVFTMLNAFWLMPLYASAPKTDETMCINDPVVQVSIAVVPPGSHRLIASAVASYLIFGYSMFCIWKELNWYATYKHKFLSRSKERNYTVLMRYLPPEYQSNAKLIAYFESVLSFDDSAILEVNLARRIPKLTAAVAQRDAMVTMLEHAVNVQRVARRTPTHSTRLIGGEQVDSIPAYSMKLRRMNEGLVEDLVKLHDLDDSHLLLFGGTDAPNEANESGGAPEEADRSGSGNGNAISTDMQSSTNVDGDDDANDIGNGSSDPGLETTPLRSDDALALNNPTYGDGGNSANGDDNDSIIPEFLRQGSLMLAELWGDRDDGDPLSAAFVSFRSRRAPQIAMQMRHHESPHTMEAIEAPEPCDILWDNIGSDHSSTQIGGWLSFGFSCALLLFWTSVVAFASSLSSIEGLRAVKFIDDVLERSPWLEPALAQVAPFIVVVIQSLLETILTIFSKLERPVAGAILESSLFTKLGWFMIIQNFFVLSLSGGVLTTYEQILDRPKSAVDVLATALPSQSTFHTQILLVNAFVSLGTELLRITPVAIAKVREWLGPGLTEKERKTPWMGLSPLNDPGPFTHASSTSWNVLYFMVLYVYSTIAPVTSFFLALCFFLMSISYRHQFVYIYPSNPDSGGKIYGTFLNLTLTCMIVAEITVLGLYGIKLSPIASGMMTPLLVVTIAFVIYMRQQHFTVADHLPGRRAIEVDAEPWDEAVVRGAYTQPDLKTEKYAWPDNMDNLYDRYAGSGPPTQQGQSSTIPSQSAETQALGNFV